MLAQSDGDELYSGIAARPRPAIESAAIVATQPPDPIVYDVESILPADDAPGLMFGPPGSLKSWLALAICDAIVRGEPFVGFETRRRERALYLNLDAGEKTFRNRVRSISDAEGFDFVTLSASQFSPSLLREYLEQYAGGFVVIDCLSSIYEPDMRTDPAHAMRAFVDDLRALFAAFDCGGLVIDHPHRPKEKGELGDYHGSIQKEAAFRTMWSIAAATVEDGDEQKPRRVKIACRKLSEGQPFGTIEVDVDFAGQRVSIARVWAEQQPPDERAAMIEAKILEWARRELTAFSKHTVTQNVHGYGVRDIRAAFDRLVERGDLEDTKRRRGGAPTFRARVVQLDGTNPDEPDKSQELPIVEAAEAPRPVSRTNPDEPDHVGSSGSSRPPIPPKGGRDEPKSPPAAAALNEPAEPRDRSPKVCSLFMGADFRRACTRCGEPKGAHAVIAPPFGAR